MTGVRMLCTRCGMVGLFKRGRCPTCEPETDDVIAKERRLAQVVAELQRNADLAEERDTLIRDLVRTGDRYTGSRLAKACGLTRVRIHQIAKG